MATLKVQDTVNDIRTLASTLKEPTTMLYKELCDYIGIPMGSIIMRMAISYMEGAGEIEVHNGGKKGHTKNRVVIKNECIANGLEAEAREYYAKALVAAQFGDNRYEQLWDMYNNLSRKAAEMRGIAGPTEDIPF